jgi:glycosyltransferase involved in cell wall biosynthesis
MKENTFYMPRFSIVITCYNQSAFIRETVGSALAQDYKDKEIIVVDDASTDGSKEILEEFGGLIKLILLETNEGASVARNRGASVALGDFLVFLDGDDLLLPWALNVYNLIIDFKSPKLILCKMLWFEGTFSSVRLESPPSEVRVVDYEAFMKKDRAYRASASALVIDSESFNNNGGWAHGFFPMEDHDLLLKLGYSGRTIQITSPITTAYRVHTNNATHQHQLQKIIDQAYKLMRREELGHYPGGRACRSERFAVIGGVVFYWLKRSLKAKLYREGLKLLVAGWPMIITAMYRRCVVVIRGRLPEETLTLESPVRFR